MYVAECAWPSWWPVRKAVPRFRGGVARFLGGCWSGRPSCAWWRWLSAGPMGRSTQRHVAPRHGPIPTGQALRCAVLLSEVFLKSKVFIGLDTLILRIYLPILKINNFRGDLSDKYIAGPVFYFKAKISGHVTPICFFAFSKKLFSWSKYPNFI